jgi:fucose 4-O-acetylase-like acetyltransferase
MKTERIGYIDAMRGFTMILVVYSHICSMCFGDAWMGWNDVFFLFRLPCFFFISGWLFENAAPHSDHGSEKIGRQWNSDTIWQMVKHKFMVQIVPTVIFLLILAPPPLFFSRLGATKGGYWFTFLLFIFFVLHIFLCWITKKMPASKQEVLMLLIAILITVASCFYEANYLRHFSQMGLGTSLMGFLSFRVWPLYIFFYLGTLVKRHFDVFILWTNKLWLMALIVIGFVAIAIRPHSDDAITQYLIFSIGGILGMTMVFTFFRHLYTSPLLSLYSSIFHHPSSILKFVGTRTLDIYLLHYFFLPRFMMSYADQLQAYDSKLIEFSVVMLLAMVVVAICLLMSYIIRLSPFLGHYLFGVKCKVS